MGADIHMFIEKRMPSGSWACVRNLNESLHSEALGVLTRATVPKDFVFTAYWDLVSRNYELFARLAGVRGEGPPPKGLPDDVSEFVEAEYEGWGHDAHSVSWYSADEFVQIYTRTDWADDEDTPLNPYVARRLDSGTEMSVALFLRDKASVYVQDHESVDDYRFVFWFDN